MVAKPIQKSGLCLALSTDYSPVFGVLPACCLQAQSVLLRAGTMQSVNRTKHVMCYNARVYMEV